MKIVQHKMKRKVFFLITLFISIIGYCQTSFTVNNITYTTIPSVPNAVNITAYNTAGGTNVNIPATVSNSSITYNVTGIGVAAFFNKSLTNLTFTLPSNLTTISSVAFRVNQLSNITFPDSVTTIETGAFVGNSTLTSVTLGANLTTIGSSAFGGCAITNITIPNSVTTIGSSAFGNNQLVNVIIGSGVTSIGTSVFTGNSSLNSITSKAISAPSITTSGSGSDTFSTDRSGINLTIPSGTSSSYITALWTGFNNITQASIITFDDQSHSNNEELGNPYSIVNNGETFNFTISGGAVTNNIYRTLDASCSNTGISHLFAGNSSSTTWTIETNSGNQINLVSLVFDNIYTCTSTTYNLTIEGFKNNVSTGTQTLTVTGVNSVFNPNTVFSNVDKIVITGTDISKLGIDDINWAAVPAASVPSLTTSVQNTVTHTSVVLGGNVTANGGETVTERGVVYSNASINTNPAIGGFGVTKDTNGTGTGVFSEMISGLEAATQYSFRAYATNSVGTTYGVLYSFTTTGKNWTGNTNTDWATATNWNPNTIPIASDNITISNVANKPVISSSTGAIANDITIDTSSSLTINDGGSLIVSGTVSGNVTYNRNISFISGNLNGWYLMASPVMGQIYDDAYVTANDIANNGLNRGIATYITSGDSWSYLQSGNTGSFNPGQGYSIKRGTNTGNVSFTGTLNTNNSGVDIVLNNVGSRFNLLGNPYTSYINSATFLNNETSISDTKTLWVWNQSLSTNGAYEAKIILNNFKIAPGQGFFVQANTSGGTFNFIKSNQSHNATDTFQKTSAKKFNLNLSDGTVNNYATIYYLNKATTGFDIGYDGEMFSGISNSFAIYTHLISDNLGKNFQIQSLPDNNYENMVIPIGLNVAAGKEITFTLNNLNLPSNIKVFIEDKETNTIKRLDELNGNYKITTNSTLNGTGRFYLHTTSNALSLDILKLKNINIHTIKNKTIRIKGIYNGNTNVKVFNSLGIEVLKTSFKSNGSKDVDLSNLVSGIYFVKLMNDKTKINKKIILE